MLSILWSSDLFDPARWPRRPAGVVLAGCLVIAVSVPVPALAQDCIVDQVTDTIGLPNVPNLNGEPSISADGLSIAFQSDAEPLPGSNPDGNFEIWLYDVSGDSFTQVTDTSVNFDYNARPAISGDGLWVAFEGSPELFPGGGHQIGLYDVAAGTLLQITNVTGAFVAYPEINGDGTLISFASSADLVAGENLDGSSEIFLYNRTTDTFSQVTDTVGGNTDLSGLDAAGSLVVFSSTADVLAGGNPDGNTEIFLFDVVTATTTQITNAVGGGSYSPVLSADGAWIALHSDRDLVPGGNIDASIEVYLYDIAGASFIQVTNSTGLESYSPSINGDGTKIAFASFNDLVGNNPDGNNELFVYDAPTNAITQITDTLGPIFFYMMGASMSDDGTRVAFESYADVTGGNPDGNGEIYLANCSAEEPEQPSQGIPTVSGFGLLVLVFLTAFAAIVVLRRRS